MRRCSGLSLLNGKNCSDALANVIRPSINSSIRKIQNETHQMWAQHLFTDHKIKNPLDFWIGVQERILGIFEPGQCEQWRQMAGAPLKVDLREGYPFDGRDVNVPKPGPFFDSLNAWRGEIAVMKFHQDFPGSGFGHKIRFDDKQYYSWRGKEIAPTAFEIAVTVGPLSEEERKHLVTKDDPSSATNVSGALKGWMVLFRSADPSVWNTDTPDETRFAIPVARADSKIRFLRLKRMDTGEMLIIPISRANLAEAPKSMGDHGFVWNGLANDAFGGRHLGDRRKSAAARTKAQRTVAKGTVRLTVAKANRLGSSSRTR